MKLTMIKTVLLVSQLFVFSSHSFGNEPLPNARQHWIENQKCEWKLDVTLNHPNGLYRVGEDLQLSVVAPKDCYVHIININPDGEFSVLWPLKTDASSHVKANEKITFPADGDHPTISFKASQPVGKELIVCFATTRPLNLQQERDKKLFHDFMQGVEKVLPASISRIKSFVTMVQQDDAGWTAQAIEVTTVMP